MENENTKSLVISSLIWKYLERIGYQGIQFIVSIILARLLLPSDYGAIAMITVFIAISEVFIQSGFSSALIQQKDVDDLDFSSVFYAGLAINKVFELANSLVESGATYIATGDRANQTVGLSRLLATGENGFLSIGKLDE